MEFPCKRCLFYLWATASFLQFLNSANNKYHILKLMQNKHTSVFPTLQRSQIYCPTSSPFWQWQTMLEKSTCGIHNWNTALLSGNCTVLMCLNESSACSACAPKLPVPNLVSDHLNYSPTQLESLFSSQLQKQPSRPSNPQLARAQKGGFCKKVGRMANLKLGPGLFS